MTTTAALAPVELGIKALEQARGFTLALAEDIPADKMLHRPVPNGNHALYVLGHLAWADDGFRTGLGGGEPLAPELTKERFGYGITLSDDPGVYPAPSLILERLASTRQTLIEWFNGMDEAQLRTPLPEDYQAFAPNFAALMGSIAWHEGVHTGQLTVIRKSLGLAPKFG